MKGAAWLTAALALATVVLSAVFRGGVLCDPRLGRLRRLAWLWSAENLLLALAVYHRMYIYVGFNGMTRMRTVGLFGISAVVVGLVFVIWKIIYSRDFLWLFHRQLWTVAVAAYLFALAPVDAIVHAYNRQRILDGDPAPSVQISVHAIDSEGMLVLRPLVRCKDPVIREGILRDAGPAGGRGRSGRPLARRAGLDGLPTRRPAAVGATRRRPLRLGRLCRPRQAIGRAGAFPRLRVPVVLTHWRRACGTA